MPLQWRNLSPTIESGPRYVCASIRLGEEAFFIGGEDHERFRLDSIVSFNLTTEQWSNHPSLPDGPRAGCSAAAVDDHHFVVIGGYPGHRLGRVVLYNVDTQTWSTLPDLRIGRFYPACVVAHGMLYAIGGFNANNGGSQDSVEKLDLDSATIEPAWQTLSQGMRTCRSGCAAVFHSRSGLVIVTGGHNRSDGYLNTCEVYNPQTELWNDPITLPPMLDRRAFHASVILRDNLLVVMGGEQSPATPFSTVEVLNLGDLGGSPQWIRLSNMNNPRVGFVAFSTADEEAIIVAGGRGEFLGVLDTMEMLRVEPREGGEELQEDRQAQQEGEGEEAEDVEEGEQQQQEQEQLEEVLARQEEDLSTPPAASHQVHAPEPPQLEEIPSGRGDEAHRERIQQWLADALDRQTTYQLMVEEATREVRDGQAQRTASLQAQIAALQAQIAALQAQVDEVARDGNARIETMEQTCQERIEMNNETMNAARRIHSALQQSELQSAANGRNGEDEPSDGHSSGSRGGFSNEISSVGMMSANQQRGQADEDISLLGMGSARAAPPSVIHGSIEQASLHFSARQEEKVDAEGTDRPGRGERNP